MEAKQVLSAQRILQIIYELEINSIHRGLSQYVQVILLNEHVHFDGDLLTSNLGT